MGFRFENLSADLNLQVRFGGSSPTSMKQKAISIVRARNNGISASVAYSDKNWQTNWDDIAQIQDSIHDKRWLCQRSLQANIESFEIFISQKETPGPLHQSLDPPQ